MGRPFSCKVGKHTWEPINKKGHKFCKYCVARRFVGINIKENIRCKLDFHSFKNMVRGEMNTCLRCGGIVYVKKYSQIGNFGKDWDTGV